MTPESRSPLEELAGATRQRFDHLLGARRRTAEGLAERRSRFAALEMDDDAAIVLTGSWGRGEVTGGSDDDYMVLVEGPERQPVRPALEEVKSMLGSSPEASKLFGTYVFGADLVGLIGGDRDLNRHLTHRMLLLLESVPVRGEAVHARVKSSVLARYLDQSFRDKRPPRFLLNDVVRYWRTVCVDFAGKEHDDPAAKWGLRNAKLRLSRKLLFASGLLPILECHRHTKAAMTGYLEEALALPPTDRVASAFLRYEALDAGARTLGAYDEFLGRLDQKDFRDKLKALTREEADGSAEFQAVHRLGREMNDGLLALLFETELRDLVRDYAVF